MLAYKFDLRTCVQIMQTMSIFLAIGNNFLENLSGSLIRILCVSPHGGIGRYVETINGKSTRQWYQIKKQELKILENHVSDVFDYLKKHIWINSTVNVNKKMLINQYQLSGIGLKSSSPITPRSPLTYQGMPPRSVWFSGVCPIL